METALIIGLVSVAAIVLVGNRLRGHEAKLAKYKIDEAERERADREKADLIPQVVRSNGGAHVHIYNDGQADAKDASFALHYPNSAEFDGLLKHRDTQRALTVPLIRAGGEHIIPLQFLKEHLRPPLQVTQRWTDVPTGKLREEGYPCTWT